MLSNKDRVSYLVQILNGVIPLLIIFLLLRKSDLRFMGDYFLALSIVGSTQVVVDYGFNISGVRSFATLLDRRASAADIWSLLFSIVAAKLLIAVLLSVGVMVYMRIAAPANALYVALCVATGVALSVTNATPLVFALKQSIHLSIGTFVVRLIFLLPLFATEPSLLVLFILTFAPILIANLYSVAIAHRYIPCGVCEVKVKPNVLNQFVEGRSIFLNSILASLISIAWPLLLFHFLTRVELGVYGIADRIVRGLMVFVSPLHTFILASSPVLRLSVIVSSLLKQRLNRIFLIAVLLAPFALVALPDSVVRLFLGDAVIEYRAVLSVYGFGYLFYVCDLILYTFMVVLRQEVRYVPIVLVSFMASSLIGYVFSFEIYAPLIFESLVSFMLALLLMRIRKMVNRGSAVGDIHGNV